MVPELPEALAEYLQARKALPFLFLLLNFQNPRPQLLLRRPGAQDGSHAHNLGHHTGGDSPPEAGLCTAAGGFLWAPGSLGLHLNLRKHDCHKNHQNKSFFSILVFAAITLGQEIMEFMIAIKLLYRNYCPNLTEVISGHPLILLCCLHLIKKYNVALF